jgi:hypothetical protein
MNFAFDGQKSISDSEGPFPLGFTSVDDLIKTVGATDVFFSRASSLPLLVHVFGCWVVLRDMTQCELLSVVRRSGHSECGAGTQSPPSGGAAKIIR